MKFWRCSECKVGVAAPSIVGTFAIFTFILGWHSCHACKVSSRSTSGHCDFFPEMINERKVKLDKGRSRPGCSHLMNFPESYYQITLQLNCYSAIFVCWFAKTPCHLTPYLQGNLGRRIFYLTHCYLEQNQVALRQEGEASENRTTSSVCGWTP